MPNKRKKSGAAVPPAKKAKVEQPVEETPTPKEVCSLRKIIFDVLLPTSPFILYL
jgi:hypothetical protein